MAHSRRIPKSYRVYEHRASWEGRGFRVFSFLGWKILKWHTNTHTHTHTHTHSLMRFPFSFIHQGLYWKRFVWISLDYFGDCVYIQCISLLLPWGRTHVLVDGCLSVRRLGEQEERQIDRKKQAENKTRHSSYFMETDGKREEKNSIL